MLDALIDRTRGTAVELLRDAQHDVEADHERHSAVAPFPLWSSVSSAINVPSAIRILPFKTKIKQGVPGSPSRNCPFELEITFCVRGVLSPLLSNRVLDELDQELERRGPRFVRYADDCAPRRRERRIDAKALITL